tara:strand:- start:585 stop:1034 length:450 start_codon:yes stop_codon:yes gene_type:complete
LADGMLRRAEDSAARRTARLAAREEKEKTVAKKKSEREMKRKEKLFNTPVPEEGRRLTKSATNRAKLVQDDIAREAASAEEEARQKKIRDRKEREMSQILSHEIKERERVRREEFGHFREISEVSEFRLNLRALEIWLVISLYCWCLVY